MILKDDNKGMITIEACVIIPVILGITFLLIWLSLYFYNKITISNAASVAAIYAAGEAELSNEEIADIARDKASEMLEGRLVDVGDITSNISVEYGLVKVNISTVMEVPGLWFWTKNNSEEGWGIDITQDAPRLRCSRIIRTANRVGRTVSANNV